MIDVIVPCLARPNNAAPLMLSFQATAPEGAILWFVCTPGDVDQIAACRATEANVLVGDWPAGPGDYARKINHGYRAGSNPYLLNGSDDITFEPGWATQALKRMQGDVTVVATNDMANRSVQRGDFGTHCLILRRYVTEQGGTANNEPGVVLYEGYDHNFVDRELCGVARHRHRYAFARDSVIRHRHPLWRTAVWDDTYRKSQARFREDHLLFCERAHLWGQAGLDPHEKNSRRRDIVRR